MIRGMSVSLPADMIEESDIVSISLAVLFTFVDTISFLQQRISGSETGNMVRSMGD